MLAKPKYGEPCNRCGQCCMKFPCPVGKFLFQQETGRCPALEQDGDRFSCGLVANPHKYVPPSALPMELSSLSKAAKVMIDAGGGCDAIFAGERINAAYLESKIQESANPAPCLSFLNALAVWGIQLVRPSTSPGRSPRQSQLD
jgi:hypothetical protein